MTLGSLSLQKALCDANVDGGRGNGLPDDAFTDIGMKKLMPDPRP
jgi:hypothetical protein